MTPCDTLSVTPCVTPSVTPCDTYFLLIKKNEKNLNNGKVLSQVSQVAFFGLTAFPSGDLPCSGVRKITKF